MTAKNLRRLIAEQVETIGEQMKVIDEQQKFIRSLQLELREQRASNERTMRFAATR